MIITTEGRHKTLIKRQLKSGLNYAQVGRTLGLSRERVRQLAVKYGYARLRTRPPEGYLLLREYAESRGLTCHTVLKRVENGRIPALKLYDQWYVHQDEEYRCRTCGKPLPREVQRTHRSVCDACKLIARKRCHWRWANRRLNKRRSLCA